MTWFSRLLIATFFVHSGLHAVRLMSSYRALEIGAGPLERQAAWWPARSPAATW